MASSGRGKCCCCIPCPEPPRPQNPLDFTGGKVLGFVNYDPDHPEAGPFITTLNGENIYPNKKEAKDGWGYVWTDADLAAMNQQEPIPCIDLLNFFPPHVAERFQPQKRRNSLKKTSPDRNCIQLYSPRPMPYPPISQPIPYAPGRSSRGFVPGPYPDSELCRIDEPNKVEQKNVEILDLKDAPPNDDNMSIREIKEFEKGFYRDRKITEAIAKNTHPVVQECMPLPVPCEDPFRPFDTTGRPFHVVRQCEEFCSGICQGGQLSGKRVIPRSKESLERETYNGAMGIYAIRQCEEFCTGIKGGGQRKSPDHQSRNSGRGNLLQNYEEFGAAIGQIERKSMRTPSSKDSRAYTGSYLQDAQGVADGCQTSPSLKIYFPPSSRTQRENINHGQPNLEYDEFCSGQNGGAAGQREAALANCSGCPCTQRPFYPNMSTYVAFDDSFKSDDRKKRKIVQESSSDSSDDSEAKSRPWYFQGLRYPAKKIRL